MYMFWMKCERVSSLNWKSGRLQATHSCKRGKCYQILHPKDIQLGMLLLTNLLLAIGTPSTLDDSEDTPLLIRQDIAFSSRVNLMSHQEDGLTKSRANWTWRNPALERNVEQVDTKILSEYPTKAGLRCLKKTPTTLEEARRMSLRHQLTVSLVCPLCGHLEQRRRSCRQMKKSDVDLERKTPVTRFGYNEYMTHHYAITMKVEAE